MSRISAKLYKSVEIPTRSQKAYQVNIFLNPLKNLPLIQQPSIQISVRPHLLAGEKSIWTNPIIEGDDHHITISSINQTVWVHIRSGIRVESTTLEEDKNGMQSLVVTWCIDIEKQTIF